MVEFGQSPIDQSQLGTEKLGQTWICATGFAYFTMLVVYHDIMGFDVSMHDTLGVAIVQGLEEGEEKYDTK